MSQNQRSGSEPADRVRRLEAAVKRLGGVGEVIADERVAMVFWQPAGGRQAEADTCKAVARAEQAALAAGLGYAVAWERWLVPGRAAGQVVTRGLIGKMDLTMPQAVLDGSVKVDRGMVERVVGGLLADIARAAARQLRAIRGEGRPAVTPAMVEAKIGPEVRAVADRVYAELVRPRTIAA